jgi:hypothetical protein
MTKKSHGGVTTTTSKRFWSGITKKKDQYAEHLLKLWRTRTPKDCMHSSIICFICTFVEHEVDVFPINKQPQQLGKFVGSVASGLGFYHIEFPLQIIDNPCPKNIGWSTLTIVRLLQYQGLATIEW